MTFKELLEKKGISKKDIPLAIVYFKATSYATWFGTLALCYKYRPLRRLIKSPFFEGKFKNLKLRYPKFYNNCENFITSKSKKLAEWKYFKPIPESLGLKSLHVVEALSENFILYKLLLPLILPLQFWFVLKKMNRNSDHIKNN